MKVNDDSLDHEAHDFAAELNAMTPQERNQMYEEIHGVATTVKESNEFMMQSLELMKDEIRKLSKQRRRSLERARFLYPALKDDNDLHFQFLRANRYNATRAAANLCLFFEYKQKLFGEEKLVNEITFEDLDQDDLACLHANALRIIPEKDSSGRFIIMLDFAKMRFRSWKNQARCLWYIIMPLTRYNFDVQMQGVVYCAILVGIDGESMAKLVEFIRETSELEESLPIWFSAVHACHDGSSNAAALLHVIRISSSKDMRLRWRAHCGSVRETKDALGAFGIRLSTLSAAQEVASLQDFISARKTKEKRRREEIDATISRTDMIPYPSQFDVLLGRGRSFQDYIGNQRFNQVLRGFEVRYSQCNEHLGKSVIAMEIAAEVKSLGGRFLHRTPEGWSKAADLAVREKICQALRLRIRQLSPQPE